MTENQIIIIDDDIDDTNFIREVLIELNVQNKIVIFNDALLAYDYFKSLVEKPLFVICDINMPKLTGLQLRQKINENEKLRLYAIPFLFWSTSGSELLINQAFSLNVQGFFKKPHTFEKLKEMLSAILNYWNLSDHPLL